MSYPTGCGFCIPDARESIAVEYQQKRREHQTDVVRHIDESDKYDRRVFGSRPFCALLARPRNPGSMSESCGHNQGVASASSEVAGTPRARCCDKSKSQQADPRRSESQIIPRESHTCMGSADTDLINHNAWLHGFDRS
ncbi:hypothetical protein N9L68_08750 [bacterium]|nr:hypothetical protein [bacterium]